VLGALRTLDSTHEKQRVMWGKGGGVQHTREKKTLHTLGILGALDAKHKKHKGREVQHTIDEKKVLCALGVLKALGGLDTKHKKYRGRGGGGGGGTTHNKLKKTLHTLRVPKS